MFFWQSEVRHGAPISFSQRIWDGTTFHPCRFYVHSSPTTKETPLPERGNKGYPIYFMKATQRL